MATKSADVPITTAQTVALTIATQRARVDLDHWRMPVATPDPNGNLSEPQLRRLSQLNDELLDLELRHDVYQASMEQVVDAAISKRVPLSDERFPEVKLHAMRALDFTEWVPPRASGEFGREDQIFAKSALSTLAATGISASLPRRVAANDTRPGASSTAVPSAATFDDLRAYVRGLNQAALALPGINVPGMRTTTGALFDGAGQDADAAITAVAEWRNPRDPQVPGPKRHKAALDALDALHGRLAFLADLPAEHAHGRSPHRADDGAPQAPDSGNARRSRRRKCNRRKSAAGP